MRSPGLWSGTRHPLGHPSEMLRLEVAKQHTTPPVAPPAQGGRQRASCLWVPLASRTVLLHSPELVSLSFWAPPVACPGPSPEFTAHQPHWIRALPGQSVCFLPFTRISTRLVLRLCVGNGLHHRAACKRDPPRPPLHGRPQTSH